MLLSSQQIPLSREVQREGGQGLCLPRAHGPEGETPVRTFTKQGEPSYGGGKPGEPGRAPDLCLAGSPASHPSFAHARQRRSKWEMSHPDALPVLVSVNVRCGGEHSLLHCRSELHPKKGYTER